jgi:hypothetical protein
VIGRLAAGTQRIRLAPDAVLTPLARDECRARRIAVERNTDA